MLVVVGAAVLRHTLGRDCHFHDARLYDGAGAIHAGHDLNENRAAFGGRAGARGVADGVALGVFDPKVLGGANQPLGDVVADAAREGIVTGGADFVVRPDDHAADLGVRILTTERDHLADFEIILVPSRNG